MLNQPTGCSRATFSVIVFFSILCTFVLAAEKPNVIMIYTDDMGYGDISSFSNALPVHTTNIDRLATEGKKFTQFYVSMPICSPSRSAVLSGKYSPGTQLTNYLNFRDANHDSDSNDWMDPDQSFLPKIFKNAGYATGHVGKWHLGGGRDVDNAPSIGEYGYDEFYSTWESPNPDPELGIKYPPWNRNLDPGQVIRHKRTEYMVDRSLDFLDRHSTQPCFITFWPDDLHTPFWPNPTMLAKYGGDGSKDNTIENFYGVLEEYDRQIGRFLDELHTRGLDNNTIIFFTGDNGPSPVFSNHLRTDGLRGRKLSLYEGGIREPFIIRWPGHIAAGTEDSDTILSSIDLVPTLASLAGIQISSEVASQLDGEDMSQAILGSPMQRAKPLVWEYGRTGKVPRPAVGNIDRSPILAIRDGDFKLLVNPNNSGHELYNVRTDPNETNNIASQNSALTQQLAQQVIAWDNTLPHRSHPYPAFSTVDFNQFHISEIASPSALQTASNAQSTTQVSGVTADPYWYGDIYALHEDAQGINSILRIDNGNGSISKITDSALIAQNIGIPATPVWPLVAGFDYAPGGNRLFLAQENPTASNGETLLVRIDASTGVATQVARTPSLSGLTDMVGLPDGTLAAARGINGNRTIGNINVYYGSWTQKVTEAQLLSATPGASSLPPEAVGVNNSGGEVYISAHGDLALFKSPDLTVASPSVSRLTQSILNNSDFHDLSVDQAGNLYGFDQSGERIIIVRAQDNTIFTISFASIASALGSSLPFSPTEWRGLAARMVKDEQSELYLASSTGDYGIIRIRFGQPPSSVEDWTLY